MSDRFEEALEELSRRTQALGVQGDDDVTVIYGQPEVLARRVVSGYVPLEDADQAMRFAQEVSEAILRMIGGAPNTAVALAGLKLTVAQVLVVGVILERQEAE